MMPKLDGMEVCRRLKADPNMPFMPIILVTAKAASTDVVAGLEAGADEYLTKPIDQMALVARVKSVLRIKELHDQVSAQAADLATWNRTLEQRVERAGCRGFYLRRSRTSFSPAATIACWKVTAVRLPSYFAICAASPRSPN
jgi:DNA-binding response OmpR family regulator